MLFAAAPHGVRAQQPDALPVPVLAMAEKLGVTPAPTTPRELELGGSATGMVTDPQKLAPYGIKRVHEGARVTFTCVGPSRVRVEADEIEPVAVREVVTLKIEGDGSMTRVPDRPPPPKPPM